LGTAREKKEIKKANENNNNLAYPNLLEKKALMLLL
jgi:hypothetical protein